MTTLFVTHPLGAPPAGGRAMLSRMTHDALQDLHYGRLAVTELSPERARGADKLAAMRGHIDGVGDATLAGIVDRVRAEGIRLVVLDGSNLGEVARMVKAQCPGVRVATFFHNVEARFFLGSLRQERSLHAAGVLVANYLAERKACRWSDLLVCLTPRDADLVRRLYGRADAQVCPMAVSDARPDPPPAPSRRPPYALFVGGTFYANREGIRWFVENVAPRIPMTTCIVGRGFEGLRAQLERPGKVEVVGEAEDLAPWYAGARVVVAPIFDGSGMKTKVAEALMFGKAVVGTPDAFAGYEALQGQAGPTCRTADEFVDALTQLASAGAPPFDARLRALYEQHHSAAAYRARLGAILGHGGAA